MLPGEIDPSAASMYHNPSVSVFLVSSYMMEFGLLLNAEEGRESRIDWRWLTCINNLQAWTSTSILLYKVHPHSRHSNTSSCMHVIPLLIRIVPILSSSIGFFLSVLLVRKLFVFSWVCWLLSNNSLFPSKEIRQCQCQNVSVQFWASLKQIRLNVYTLHCRVSSVAT